VPRGADQYSGADNRLPRAGHDADGGLGIERPHDVRRFSHEAMATVFEVHAVHPDESYAAQAAQAAFDLVDRLERELSRFLTNSDIARINNLAAGERTRVSPSTLECLVIARHMFDLTGGAFDVSIGTGLPSLELDADAVEVAATRGGVRVDLGGVGKGYAVDRMAELMDEWGVGVALVHGGFSSVLALDPPGDQHGWPLTLSDPRAPDRVLARLSVRQTALGASGLRKGDHIVDPRTGGPVRGRVAAWAAVPRPEAARSEAPPDAPRIAAAAVTDALTTAFMLLSAEEIEDLCERSPGLEAWILPEPSDDGDGGARLVHFGGVPD
jgi:FAD:protein FMN transferase